ncbi:anaphase-promoting complex subunit 2 [Pseudoscourfieldia marina]
MSSPSSPSPWQVYVGALGSGSLGLGSSDALGLGSSLSSAIASIVSIPGGAQLVSRHFVNAAVAQVNDELMPPLRAAAIACLASISETGAGAGAGDEASMPQKMPREDMRALEDALARAAAGVQEHTARCDALGEMANLQSEDSQALDEESDNGNKRRRTTKLRRMFELEVQTAAAMAMPSETSEILTAMAVRALDDFQKKRDDAMDDDDDEEEEEEEDDDDDDDEIGDDDEAVTMNHDGTSNREKPQRWLPGSTLLAYQTAHANGAFAFGSARSFQRTCFHLRVLGLGGVLDASLGNAVRRCIAKWLSKRADGTFDEVCLRPLWRFVGRVVLSWLRLANHSRLSESSDHLWRQRLRHLALDMLCTTRADALFDMIVDYPDSLPALRDLAVCLQVHPERLEGVAKGLRASIKRRLLHPGASTSDLLTQYASMAKSLGHVDSSGTVLAVAGAPVAAYLRGRPDAVRGIVEMVSENEETDEMEESAENRSYQAWVESVFGGAAFRSLTPQSHQHEDPGTSATQQPTSVECDRSAPGLEPWDAWNPGPPRLASLGSSAAAPPTGAAAGSLTSTLVGIYGREALANEYRDIMANRLLARFGYAIDRELRSVELLKMRLGESPLRQVEVMLRDMADSRRVHAGIRAMQSTPGTPTSVRTPGRAGGTPRTPFGPVTMTPRPVAAPAAVGDATARSACAQSAALASSNVFNSLSATIISHLFWPPIAKSDEALIDALPVGVKEGLEAYARRYASLKSPRKIRWLPHLGCVTLRIQGASGGTVEVQCTPAQASIIAAFTPDAPSWTLSDLARKTACSVDACRKRATFWVSRGLLLERTSQSGGLSYEAASCADGSSGGGAATIGATADRRDEDGEDGGAVASKEEQESDNMAVYESYIMGMLTNFDSLSLERIHNMLKMFVVSPKYDKSQAELSKFLQRLVTDETLMYDGGMFKKK